MTEPKDIRIIIACEESQAITKEFRRLGFQAFSCDLQECSGGLPQYHFREDIHEVLKREHFDLMVAHPPCTFLSNAGARWLYQNGKLNKERYEKGIAGKEFFLSLLNYPIRYLAVENPVPSTIYDLPQPTQIIEPYMFGDPYTKRTCLWLRNLPCLIPSKMVEPKGPYCPNKNHHGFATRGNDAVERSKTFPGIARAIAHQWGRYVLKDMNGQTLSRLFRK